MNQSPTLPNEDQELGSILSANVYLRERTGPRFSDENFLAFSDLLNVVSAFAKSANGRLFDYGCGGSPYRGLFKHCSAYIRADVTPGPDIDRLLPESGKTEEQNSSYDVVFSAQVLEHVKDPAAYVQECFRILKPGGRLFISTHGTFEEHGCPYDFQRWTAIGLQDLVRAAGFRILRCQKLTTEGRAVIQFQHYLTLYHLKFPERPLLHYPFAVVRRIYRLVFVPLLNWFGSGLDEQGVVHADSSSTLYIGVCLQAEKPLD